MLTTQTQVTIGSAHMKTHALIPYGDGFSVVEISATGCEREMLTWFPEKTAAQAWLAGYLKKDNPSRRPGAGVNPPNSSIRNL